MPALSVSYVTVVPIQNLNLRCLESLLGSLLKVHLFIQPTVIPHTNIGITSGKRNEQDSVLVWWEVTF